MSGDLTRWLASSPAERDRNRAIERIDHLADLAHARVHAIAGLTQDAMFCGMTLKVMQRQIELMAPDAAQTVDLIAHAGILGVVSEVRRFDGRPS